MALNGNQITDAGLVVLAEVLRENTTLKDLGLYGNPMSDAAKQAVLAIVDDASMSGAHTGGGGRASPVICDEIARPHCRRAASHRSRTVEIISFGYLATSRFSQTLKNCSKQLKLKNCNFAGAMTLVNFVTHLLMFLAPLLALLGWVRHMQRKRLGDVYTKRKPTRYADHNGYTSYTKAD